MSEDKDTKNKSIVQSDLAKVPMKQSQSFGILEAGLANMSPQKKQEILDKAGELALDLEVEGRKKVQQSQLALGEIDYVLQRVEDTSSMQGTSTRVKGEFKTASGRINIEARKGLLGGCFVATVAFDSPDAAEVVFLRQFRDTVLLKSSTGQKFIRWYYINGPHLAAYVENDLWLRRRVKRILSALVKVLKWVSRSC